MLVNESERSVLELSGKDLRWSDTRASEVVNKTLRTKGWTYTLAMAVGDLLDLECTLEARSELVASSHDEQTLLLGERTPGELLEGLVLLEDARDLAGQLVQTVDDVHASLLLAERVLGELDGHHDESLNRKRGRACQLRGLTRD